MQNETNEQEVSSAMDPGPHSGVVRPPIVPMTLSATSISFNMSLPLIGVGLVTLLLSLCFCCYLWKLRRQSDEERGYSQLSFSPKSKKMKNDTCPVCLEEFNKSERLAVCPCRHGFHTKCLQQWLDQHNTCPMCKTRVVHQAGETTGLITTSMV